jgi:hypothetical protein
VFGLLTYAQKSGITPTAHALVCANSIHGGYK